MKNVVFFRRNTTHDVFSYIKPDNEIGFISFEIHLNITAFELNYFYLVRNYSLN